MDYINIIINAIHFYHMPLLAHSTLGLIVKRFVPQIPLWAILLCTNLIDILFFIGITEVTLTHGLFMAIVWSMIAMIITAFISKYLNSKTRRIEKEISKMNTFHISIVIIVLVFSHWVIDLIGWSMSGIGIPLLFNSSQTIRLDMLYLGGNNLLIAAIFVEFGPFILGLIIYFQYVIKSKKIKKLLLKESKSTLNEPIIKA